MQKLGGGAHAPLPPTPVIMNKCIVGIFHVQLYTFCGTQFLQQKYPL